MPEGHTIHRAARDQSPLFVGQTLRATAPDGRHVAEAAALDGRTLERIEPVGKHLFYRFDGPSPGVLHVHLALFGKFRLHELAKGLPEPKGAVRYRLVGRTHALDLHGCRTAEVLSGDAAASIKARLGPDPLDPKADAEKVFTRINKSSAPIAGLLMNQEVISGLGNIYRAEILFRQKLHPLVKGRDVGRERFDGISGAMQSSYLRLASGTERSLLSAGSTPRRSSARRTANSTAGSGFTFTSTTAARSPADGWRRSI